MNLVTSLITFAVAVNGLLSGLNVDTALVKLPTRRRIGAVVYATFARGNDLGNGLVIYPLLGIGTLLLALATALTAFFQKVSLPHALPIYLAAILWVVHLLITLIWALPTLPRQRQVANDEHQLATLFNRFERLQTVRAGLDVLIFGTTLWALVSYIS